MKKNRSWRGILIIVLLLAIGFAAVTTTLYINGTINFGSNKKDFEDNLKFTAAKLEYSDSTKTAKEHGKDGVELIDSTGKTITFTVDPLTVINENATLTYTISNTSQYDARLKEIACTVKKDVPADNPDGGTDVTDAVKSGTGEYIKLETSSTANKLLAARTGVESGNTIKVTMVKSYAGEAGVTPTEGTPETKSYTVKCTIDADAEPATAGTTSAAA